jgi:hypothetical protein
MLERVHQAVRNSDRRVAKLMQQRLDGLLREQTQRKKAQACIESGQKLLTETLLTPNQVAELDRAWQTLADIAPELTAQFDAMRNALGQRLLAQTDLQRTVIDALATLRKLSAEVMACGADLCLGQDPEQFAVSLDALVRQITICRSAPEVASLPKHLFADFAQEYDAAKASVAALDQRHALLRMRQTALTAWEADWEALGETPPAAEHTSVSALRRDWQAFPALPPGEAALQLQARFDRLIMQMVAAQPVAATPVVLAKSSGHDVAVDHVAPDSAQSGKLFATALEAMETALAEGLLQMACEQDKILRDLKQVRPSEAQAGRMGQARAELQRLQGWAKWGGNVSREELVKAVEELPAKQLPVTELAKKVGSSRERWKGLDSSAGPASRELWERFDAACSIAYAPAAAHFKKLSEERQQNVSKAAALLAEVENFGLAFASTLAEATEVDWKSVTNFCQRISQSWQRIGTMERKDKRRLDGEFERALALVQEPLTRQRALEMVRREQLISDAGALNPHERGALDALRLLQERWQEQAKALPLERRPEQELWQRFRAACDAVFAARKESASTADTERRIHLAAKEALCASLEAAAQSASASGEQGQAKLLRESLAAWNGIGAAPRAAEQQIEQRFQAARNVLQLQLDQVKREAGLAQVNALRTKLHLCQALEAALADTAAASDVEHWNSRWNALPPLANALEQALTARFQTAIMALQAGPASHVALLARNQALLAQDVLRLEIVLGLDSPAGLSRERLKLQVEVLQSSLKSGQKPVTQAVQLLHLCALPAAVDTQLTQRMDQLLAAMTA